MTKFILITAIVLAIASFTIIGCSDADSAKKTLDDAGLSEVVITGRPGLLWWFSGCGDDDYYATGFTGKNAKGKTVHGVVCNGFWNKASTVRYF